MKKPSIKRADRITQIATELFGQYGYTKTTLDDIAKAAGIGKGSIYLEFETKEDIFKAVAVHFFDAELRKMKRIANDEKPPYLPKLKKLMLQYLLSIFQSATQQQHSAEALTLKRHQLRQEIQWFLTEKHQILASLLKKAANHDEIAPQKNYITLAKLLTRATEGFMPPYTPELTATIIKKEARLLIHLFCQGLKTTTQDA